MTAEEQRKREVAALRWMVKARGCLDQAAQGSTAIKAEQVANNLHGDLEWGMELCLDTWNNSGDPDCRPITMEEIEANQEEKQ